MGTSTLLELLKARKNNRRNLLATRKEFKVRMSLARKRKSARDLANAKLRHQYKITPNFEPFKRFTSPYGIATAYADMWGMIFGNKQQTGEIAASYLPVDVTTQTDTGTTTEPMQAVIHKQIEQQKQNGVTGWNEQSFPQVSEPLSGITDIFGNIGKYALLIIIGIVIIIIIMRKK